MGGVAGFVNGTKVSDDTDVITDNRFMLMEKVKRKAILKVKYGCGKWYVIIII